MTVTLQQAQSQLPELIQSLTPGDEVVITDGNRQVARLVPAVSVEDRSQPRALGSMRGTVLYMAEDFDAPLEGFGEF